MNNKAKDLLSLRGKLAALCADVPDHVFLADGKAQHDFVEWLKSFSSRAQQILNPPQAVAVTERDMLKAFGGFKNAQRVVDWCHEKKITLPHNQHWWFLGNQEPGNPKCRTARIEGFDGNNSHPDATVGHPRITNGIDVYIERADGSTLLGHRDWLIWQRRPRVASDKTKGVGTSGSSMPALGQKELAVAAKLVALGDLSYLAERYQAACQKPLAVKLTGDKEADIANVGRAVSEYLDALAL